MTEVREVQFVTEPPPELTLDTLPQLNGRFPHIMALDLPGLVLRQCATNIHELVDRVKGAATDFDLRFLSSVPFNFETEEKGFGRGLHSDPDASPEGSRRINVTFVEAGSPELTMFEFSPAKKAEVIAGAGRRSLLPLHSSHADLYNRGLLDLDWFSAFALRADLQPGDGFVLADVNAHNITHPSFPRMSIAHLLEATPKKRFGA